MASSLGLGMGRGPGGEKTREVTQAEVHAFEADLRAAVEGVCGRHLGVVVRWREEADTGATEQNPEIVLDVKLVMHRRPVAATPPPSQPLEDGGVRLEGLRQEAIKAAKEVSAGLPKPGSPYPFPPPRVSWMGLEWDLHKPTIETEKFGPRPLEKLLPLTQLLGYAHSPSWGSAAEALVHELSMRDPVHRERVIQAALNVVRGKGVMEYPCCEGARRIERVPGDASTLVGGWCPVHGTSVNTERHYTMDQDLGPAPKSSTTCSNPMQHGFIPEPSMDQDPLPRPVATTTTQVPTTTTPAPAWPVPGNSGLQYGLRTYHKCEAKTHSCGAGPSVTSCWETEDGRLWAGNQANSSQVSFCPFCGTKARETARPLTTDGRK